MIGFRILIILILGLIFWQDCKDRMVYWFYYPLVGLLGLVIQKELVDLKMIFINSCVNLIIVGCVIGILWVYSKLILKKKLINQGIGFGDVLFFISLCFCFSMVTFLVLFVFSLFFSLLLHFLFKKKNEKDQTIPLAGFMSLFYAIVYSFTFFMNCNFLFAY